MDALLFEGFWDSEAFSVVVSEFISLYWLFVYLLLLAGGFSLSIFVIIINVVAGNWQLQTVN